MVALFNGKEAWVARVEIYSGDALVFLWTMIDSALRSRPLKGEHLIGQSGEIRGAGLFLVAQHGRGGVSGRCGYSAYIPRHYGAGLGSLGCDAQRDVTLCMS